MRGLFPGFVEEGRHIDREPVQQRRGRRVAAGEHAVLRVIAPGELEDGDRLDAGIDDPVLGDARLGVVGPLDDEIARRIIGADDLRTKSAPSQKRSWRRGSNRSQSNRRSGSRNFPGRTRIRNPDVTTTPRRGVS